MSSGNAPDTSENGLGPRAAPAVDRDPVRSPDDQTAGGSTDGFSSSESGLDNVLRPPPDEPQDKRNKQGGNSAIAPFPEATPKQNVSVGNYYMDNHDWKGALSRFQSALVLAPDDPDVYWGLAECERHLGQYAEARENYLKVMDYDPGSRHAKDAAKALRDPELANAKPAQK